MPFSDIRNVVFALALAAVFVAPSARAESEDRLSRSFSDAVRLLDGDPAKSADILAGLRDAEPIPDYIAYYHALALRQADARDAARAGFQSVLLRWPDSPVAPKAAAALAPILLATGDQGALLALAAKYAGGPGRGPDAAPIALSAGQALAGTDEVSAAGWLMRARELAPGSAAGADAASLLSELRRATPALRPSSAPALLEEAKLAAREGDRTTQRAMLDLLLDRYPSVTEAIVLRARMIAGDKGKLEAASWLEGRVDRTKSQLAQAQILYAAATYRWNADDLDEARGGFVGAITRAPGSSEAQQSHYALGRIAESQHRYAGAASEYDAASDGPGADVARESRWRAGWAAYLAGRYETAAARFARAAEKSKDDDAGREQALYWQARAEEHGGDPAAADRLYRSVVAEFPDGFYALLVEQRLDIDPSRPDVREISTVATSEYPQLLRLLDRARILEAAGLHGFAARELAAARGTHDANAARALLPELLRMGAPDQALRTAVSLYHAGDLEESELYAFLYPQPFAPIVDAESRARKLDPFLVYSLIRQESLFDRRAVSPASAYGLMQLLVPTARRMAAGDAALARVDADDLFRPEINIRLGTTYLADLAGRFDNDPVLMLAGYNAGEQAAERWRTRFSGLERDEFIESISYRETRDYVKKVLRNYRNYRRLYGGGAAVAE